MLLTDELRKSLARAYGFEALRRGLHAISKSNEPPKKASVSVIWTADIPFWFKNRVFVSVAHFEPSDGISLPPRAVILIAKDGSDNQFFGESPFEFVTLPEGDDHVFASLKDMNTIPVELRGISDLRYPWFSVQSYFFSGWSHFDYRGRGPMTDPKVIVLWQAILDLVKEIASLRNDSELILQLEAK